MFLGMSLAKGVTLVNVGNQMKTKLLIDSDAEKTWAIVLDLGEEAIAALVAFSSEQSIKPAHFTAIGAFSRATLGYFEWEAKEYSRIPIEEQVEVVSLIRDIALEDGKPRVHAQATLGRPRGITAGGH